MVNSELRHKMEHAFMKGDYDETLELSRELDIQILEEMKEILYITKKEPTRI